MSWTPVQKSGDRAAPFHRRAGVLLFAVALGLAIGARPAGAAGFWEGASRSLLIGYDAAVLRPLNAIALVVGSVFFAVSAPLVAVDGVRGSWEGIRGSWDTFVYAPYEYTFKRGLGDV